MLGSAWTVYANVFRADIYPHLDSANFDAPVVKRTAAVAARKPQTVVNEVFAALGEQAPRIAAPAPVTPSLSFEDRFAAAAPDGVEPTQQPETPKLAEVPKPKSEAPKLAEAPKPKEAAPVKVAALPPQRPGETRASKSPAPPFATWRSAPRRR